MRNEKQFQIMDNLIDLQERISNHDNWTNLVTFSEIPQICKDEPCILGVDEAGRGPVLGPMVYGIAFCPLSKVLVLKDLGCADSKTLTEILRDAIFTKMLGDEITRKSLGWATEIIAPNSICNSMYRRAKHSLNEVSMESAIGLIKKAISLEVNVTEVYVDTVGPPEKYQAKLQLIFPDIKITVSKKADSIYPIVSAASIAAKVSRDHALKVWKFKEGLEISHKEFGSGYPADPLTKKFISEQIDSIFGYPSLVRFSWSTAELALKDKAVTVTFDTEEDEVKKPPPGTKKISTFFSAKGEGEAKKKRKCHRFFEERMLTATETF